MGETEEGANKLDKQIWDADEDNAEEDEEEKQGISSAFWNKKYILCDLWYLGKEEKGGKGDKEEEKQLGASEQNQPDEGNEEQQPEEAQSKENKKKEINEMDESEFDDDQVDPYHGNQPELPEPEAMDLPDDIQFNDDNEEQTTNEENPFDIDKQKGNGCDLYFSFFIFINNFCRAIS